MLLLDMSLANRFPSYPSFSPMGVECHNCVQVSRSLINNGAIPRESCLHVRRRDRWSNSRDGLVCDHRCLENLRFSPNWVVCDHKHPNGLDPATQLTADRPTKPA